MDISKLIKKEIKRQQETITLIASENYVSAKVLEALGSSLTNKYSEGYPGRRYYPGNKVYDEIELATQNLARRVFGLSEKVWHVNVQPYSGSPANIAVYAGLLERDDVLMGLQLSHGGHLTHGHKVNLSGKLFKAVQYGVNERTGRLDYDDIFKLAKKHKPKIIVSGTTAYPRKLNFKKFGEIAKKIGAYHMSDISHLAGLVATGVHTSPFPYADIVTTTTHKTLRGPRAAMILCRKELAGKIDKAVFPGMQGGPHNNVIAAMGIALEEALKPAFKKYQVQVVKNAQVLAAELKKYGFELVSGGTDNHLILVDLKNKGITGKEAEERLEKAGILANRNTVPGDPSPLKPSGIRIGTPAVTTIGIKERDIKKLAKIIDAVLEKKHRE